MNVVISVLSVDTPPFTELEKSIRETWCNLNRPNFKIFFYYGNHNKNEIIGDKIFTISGEGLYNVGYKTLRMFEVIYKNYNFDYIFRTNSSSYVDIDNMCNFLVDKPLESFYCGVFGKSGNIDFCSGSGYFLSRDLVKRVIDNQRLWNHNYIDDVSLGLLMSQLGINRTLGKRYDFDSGLPINLNNYHYRCKISDNRLDDIKNMNLIYNLKKQKYE